MASQCMPLASSDYSTVKDNQASAANRTVKFSSVPRATDTGRKSESVTSKILESYKVLVLLKKLNSRGVDGTNVLKIAVRLVVVKPIANQESVRNGEADVMCWK